MSATVSAVPDVSPSDLQTLLEAALPARQPVIVTGAPGVGKSQVIQQTTESIDFDLVVSHPGVEDPVDAKGFPFPHPDGGSATFLPYGNLSKVLNATRPTAWFLDDFGQAPPATQASYMQWLLGGRLGEHALPEHVTMVIATNRRVDRANVSGVLEPVKSRAATIVNLIPDLDDWCTWAIAHDISPLLVAYLRFQPEMLCAFEPSADLTNSPVPRTWENFNDILGWDLPAGLRSKALAGAVGQGAAVQYEAFERMYRQLPSIDGILLNPDTAMIPETPGALYAVTTALATKATVANYGRIVTYAERLYDEKHGDMAALLVRDCSRRAPEVETTSAFNRMASGDLGQLIGGVL